jgi:hypothetical protein
LLGDEPYVVFDANVTVLRIQKVSTMVAAPHTALGWQVPDIGRAIAALREKQVAFERYAALEQDAGSVWTTPGAPKWRGSRIQPGM